MWIADSTLWEYRRGRQSQLNISNSNVGQWNKAVWVMMSE